MMRYHGGRRQMTDRDTAMDVRAITTLSFDVVGTLIDFEAGILEWFRPHLRDHAKSVEDDTILVHFAEAEARLQDEQPEMPFKAMLPRIYTDLARRWDLDTDEAAALDFRDSIRDWPPFPDAIAGLRQLATDFRLVAVTNADAWAQEAMNLTLNEPFSEQITCDEVGVNKPDPAVWKYALDKLAIEPGELLHCAQSQYHDIASARAFGLATCWIERHPDRKGWGATPKPDDVAEPDIHVHNLTQLVEHLRGALEE